MRQRKSYPKSFKTHQVDTIAFGVGVRKVCWSDANKLPSRCQDIHSVGLLG